MNSILLVLHMHHNKLKEQYVKNMGAIAVSIVEKYPELEKDIIPFITKKISKEKEEEGQKMLAQYGLSLELENQLFPYVSELSENNNVIIMLIIVGVTCISPVYKFNYAASFLSRKDLTALSTLE